MSTALQKEIQTNRMYIKCLIDIVLYLDRQGIAFRGHHNFKEMCAFLSKRNPEFCNCAASVKSTIIQEIIDCEMFSISCDEARSHKQEKISIFVRYPHGMDICERFLGFVDVSEKCFDKIPFIGQAYNEANVMSGHIGGVQAKFKIVHPPAKCAVYVYCMAHKINLVVDMCKHLKVKFIINIMTSHTMVYPGSEWIVR
ncbi:zinc finger MYM-type protein 1-like [Aphis craccivora]|uniref:Zinc finger MYM-type protein 1-like n=1 Tax=Aphis craccivora TaxID=307492 RepID=A0A6G0YD19_APHCR|nr:zinc finger MYM-type protein 1-like [Aphis craccivora]